MNQSNQWSEIYVFSQNVTTDFAVVLKDPKLKATGAAIKRVYDEINSGKGVRNDLIRTSQLSSLEIIPATVRPISVPSFNF